MPADSVNIAINANILPEEFVGDMFQVARKVMKRLGFSNNKRYTYHVVSVTLDCTYNALNYEAGQIPANYMAAIDFVRYNRPQ